MTWRRAFLILYCLLGSASFFSLKPIHRSIVERFKAVEPYFSCPVPLLGNAAVIRNDRFGKGAFGTSRNGGRRHEGIDLIANLNADVYAAKSGRVIRATEEKGYGRHVYILHPDTRVTRYAHLNSIEVTAGDWVVVGQKIGTCGKTGNAGNPKMTTHLHFEIRSPEGSIDPARGVMAPDILIKSQSKKYPTGK